MLYKELGKTGKKIPALGLGTWRIGGAHTPDHGKDREYVEILKKAIEMGYTHIDTAEMYGAGHAEELVGEAIQDFERDDLFIVTKVLPTNLKRERLLCSLQASLKRLKTDYIDLYLIHWLTATSPLQEGLEAMAQAVDEGLILHAGVSNFDKTLLKKAIALSPTPLVCNQVLYNIEEREPEKDHLLSFCQKEGITLTAYSPLGKGSFGQRASAILKEIAERHHATIYQVALAWLLAKERVVTIPKASNIRHLRENLASLDIRLSKEELKRLDENR